MLQNGTDIEDSMGLWFPAVDLFIILVVVVVNNTCITIIVVIIVVVIFFKWLSGYLEM